ISESSLLEKTAALRQSNWNEQSKQGLTTVPVGDFSLYDHILDVSTTFGAIPSRYQGLDMTDLERYFAMGRGLQRNATETRKAVDVPACEMKKFFDSNYHYIVPELGPESKFSVANSRLVDQFKEAKANGFKARPTIFGPISYLLLAKAESGAPDNFKPINLLEQLVTAYAELFVQLKNEGAEWIQVDEPALVTDQTSELAAEFKKTYEKLSKIGPKVLLATYYGSIDSNISFVKDLPIQALHIDLVRGKHQLDKIVSSVQSSDIILSLGLVDGRNIWKTDIKEAISIARKVVASLGLNRIIINSTSSLLHTPHTLKTEKTLDSKVVNWLSFAVEKCQEISVIARGIVDESSVVEQLSANESAIQSRRLYSQTGNTVVRERVKNVTPDMYNRKSPFNVRQAAQREKLNFPKFPTTTIGSFPQTTEIRVARKNFVSGEINEQQYEEFLKKEIAGVVAFQERIGLDMFVHGEPERNDMVQYFGEQLEGIVFTTAGWVQSFGTRYVRPPIIVGDVSRPNPMTVKWSVYAQSLTSKPMKGMITGPVTILNWSFPREDVPKEVSSRQLALALRDEVLDLEKAGITAIQVDEPAIREGLPLKREEWSAYLTWAVDSFRLTTAGVSDSTQIHSHFCYSDFGDMMNSIQDLDADVITIENSKSDAKLLKVFDHVKYKNEIGPGLFDIHSPRVPSVDEMSDRLKSLVEHLPKDNIWVNPDCGLKTRGWKECEEQLANLVTVAKKARTSL
ncbi:methionine-synthesizing 5- methyltetrahydropteroyltriglutamate--homocysteine methyltransferase, partial [Nowakowskiella sp. JEL0078]